MAAASEGYAAGELTRNSIIFYFVEKTFILKIQK